MKRRAGPGSSENNGRGHGSEESRMEEGNGQHHHPGWQTRESSSSASSQPAAVPGGRSPLREAPSGNRESGANSKSRRPHDVPQCAGGTAGGEQDDKGFTLRCMYTHQKTKKRKTWSDGAVKCCPKRQRVSLYRWSDALGVTDKLLGEIYLTAPQYEAFVAQGEPELEMETFLVSLDGVIQPDSDPSAGTTSSAAGGAADSAAAGRTSGGAGGVGKKRKLFKAFKPPARRAPPPAPPSDDSWGPPPPGVIGQVRNGEPNGDRRGMMSPRTSYTGFGHVESLWDDDDDDGGGGGGGDGEGMGRRGDRTAPAGGSAVESSAGWGMGAGAGYPSPRDGGGRAGGFPGRTQSPSAAPAAGPNTSDWMSRQEDGWHAAGRTSSDGLPRSAGGIAGHVPAQHDIDRFEGPAHGDQDLHDPSSYLDRLRNGDEGTGEWPGPTDSSAQRGGARDVDRAGDRGRYYSGHPRCDHDGTAVAREGKPVERNAATQYGGGGVRAPDANRDTAGRDDSGGRGGAGAVEMRSTQDILSLFGGLDEDGDEDGDDHGSPGPGGPETAGTTLRQSRGPNDAPVPPEEAARGVLLPVGGGMPRAADMRRAQKESRAAAGGGATAAAATAALAGNVDPGTRPPAAASLAAGAAPLAGWACGVCGVRGGASATSCRVCGAPRQGPTNEGFPWRGGDDHHGAVDGFFSSGHHHGWGGADFRGGEDTQEQEWDGIAGDANAGGGVGGQGDIRGGRAEGMLLREERDVAGLGHPGSRGCSPSSRMEPEDGAGGVASCSSGGVPGASSEHRAAGARMQIDVGSSSDSDDD